MNNLPTLSKAKKEIAFLQEFVYLTENYEENTLYQQIIKRYAITGTIKQVVIDINVEREKEGLFLINNVYVTEAIRSQPKDQLHRIIKTQYMNKTRHARNRFS